MEFQLKTSGEYSKYPIIFRPINTFLSFIFYPPSGIKTPFVFIFFIPILISAIYILIKKSIFNSKNILYYDKINLINLLSSITCIFIFVFMFPIYANAKYYLFLLPFLLTPFLKFYKLKDILLVFTTMNVLIILNIIVYRF